MHGGRVTNVEHVVCMNQFDLEAVFGLVKG
jgi:hypothetical protein